MNSIFQKMAETCACFYLRKAAREVSSVYDNSFKKFEIKSTQFLVLLTLKLSGQISVSQGAEALGVDRSTFSRLVIPLERRKLLKQQKGSDRRSRLLSLTEKGEKLLTDAIPYWEKAQAQVMATLGNENWNSTLGVLKKTSSLRN